MFRKDTVRYSGDYFSRTLGFVIDGAQFPDRFEAKSYLIRTGMSDSEAESYCSRIYRQYRQEIGELNKAGV